MVPVQPIQTVRPFMLLPDELFTQSPSVDGHEGAGFILLQVLETGNGGNSGGARLRE